MENCLFCKIANGEIPSEIVYEDGNTIAFLDINPINRGHTLVIPKKHFEDITDISYEAFKDVMATVKKLTPIIRKATNADGINIGINNACFGSSSGKLSNTHKIFPSHTLASSRSPTQIS